MATLTAVPAEQRVILPSVSWQTYERLLAETPESTCVRMFYDRGVLEIMTLGQEHERVKHAFTWVIETVSEVRAVRADAVGSMTLLRPDIERGFEPDAAYYIQNADRVAGKNQVELGEDPPPDLILEVDVSGSSLNKLPSYAAMGIPEVWRWRAERVLFYALRGDAYFETEESLQLPGVTRGAVQRLVLASRTEPSQVWRRNVRVWAKSL